MFCQRNDNRTLIELSGSLLKISSTISRSACLPIIGYSTAGPEYMVSGHQPGMFGLASGRLQAKPAHSEQRRKYPAGILLGGCTSFADRIAVYALIERGIAAATVFEYASAVALLNDKEILAQVTGLSMRSLGRRRRDGQNLSPDQSAQILRFAQALEKATRVFGISTHAESWISTPAMGLNWASPLQMLSNPVGFELVDDFLTRMDWGVYQ